MLGSIIGDIVGSRFEYNNYKSKEFPLFDGKCKFTDSTVMTVAVADVLINRLENYYETFQNFIWTSAVTLQKYGKAYPDIDYGTAFKTWIDTDGFPAPYGSFGNGAAMRISPVALYARSLDDIDKACYSLTSVSHDHPEGIKGANAVATCGYFAKIGKSKEFIRKYVEKNFYPLNFKIDDIREKYKFSSICQDTVPQAIECFLESTSFEDCLRLTVSLGGDTNKLCSISCGIAEHFYGIEKGLYEKVFDILDKPFLETTKMFYEKCGYKFPL